MSEFTRPFFHHLVNVALFCVLIYVTIGAPVVNQDYQSFLLYLKNNNCNLPSHVKVDFPTNIENFDYLTTPLKVCESFNTSQHYKREVKLICTEIYHYFQNISCSSYENNLPEIKVAFSSDVCKDFSQRNLSVPLASGSILPKLTDTLVCKIVCTDEFLPACQFLLWSYDVLQKVNEFKNPVISEELIGSKDNINADNIDEEIDPGQPDREEQNHVAENNDNGQLDREDLNQIAEDDHVKNNGVAEVPSNVDKTSTKSDKITAPQIGVSDSNKEANATSSLAINQAELEPALNPETATINQDQTETKLENTNKQEKDDETNKSHQIIESPTEKANTGILPKVDHSVPDVPIQSIGNQNKNEDLSPRDKIHAIPQDPSQDKNFSPIENGITEKKVLDATVLPVVPAGNSKIPSQVTTTLDKSSTLLAKVDQKEISSLKPTPDMVSPNPSPETASNTVEVSLEKMEGENDKFPDDIGEQQYGDTENGDLGEYGEGMLEGNKGKELDAEVPKSIFISKRPPAKEKEVSKTFDNFPGRNSFSEEEFSPFPEQEDSHFFFYFVSMVLIFMAIYLLVHNKQKIIALIVEGRHERRRRSHGVGYKKLETK